MRYVQKYIDKKQVVVDFMAFLEFDVLYWLIYT